MKQSKTKKLVTSAMLIALGTALTFVAEFIPFLNLPFGGTITPAGLLPLIVISYLYGLKWGLGSGLIFAVLQMAVGFKTVSALFLPSSDSYMGGAGIALIILFLDYICAFGVAGLGGVFRRLFPKKKALVQGSLFALSLTYAFHVLSGAVFYGEWASWFFTESAAAAFPFSAWIMEHCSGAILSLLYSLIYNGLYMLPEMILTALAAAFVSRIPLIQAEGERK